LKNHKDWKIPERRLAKYVKRQKQSTGLDPADDDVSLASNSSILRTRKAVTGAAKSAGRGIRRIFGRSPKKVKDDATAESDSPPRMISTTPALLPALSTEDAPDTVDFPDFFPVEEVPTVVEDRSLAPYADDNDGKKESGPCGAACEGCSIL
jgi:hypothetical protein